MLLDFISKYPFFISFIFGLIPALLWLWFWLKEDSHPEPAKMITLSFVGGMLAVVFSLPIQKIFYTLINDNQNLAFLIYASIEEILKFLTVYFIALRFKKITNEPIDDIIYLIISALGFVALENTLFLIPHVSNGDLLNTVVQGNLRFIGASLLHIMSSSAIGVMMALSFYKDTIEKMIYTFFGIIIAIILHTGFNLFIINGAEKNLFIVFGIVWFGIVLLLLLFEKIKHLKNFN